ncbi:hypothetical protein PR048_011714 [Dryococelus australis]|uniref:Uncharacterized protein n=1 Tax=Dryococelus australis TaxID=614101 RepID=A0ABQ9HN44_9NEOP|nr:hypothetical protein PR048_011714 [Dryococelus australis]
MHLGGPSDQKFTKAIYGRQHAPSPPHGPVPMANELLGTVRLPGTREIAPLLFQGDEKRLQLDTAELSQRTAEAYLVRDRVGNVYLPENDEVRAVLHLELWLPIQCWPTLRIDDSLHSHKHTFNQVVDGFLVNGNLFLAECQNENRHLASDTVDGQIRPKKKLSGAENKNMKVWWARVALHSLHYTALAHSCTHTTLHCSPVISRRERVCAVLGSGRRDKRSRIEGDTPLKCLELWIFIVLSIIMADNARSTSLKLLHKLNLDCNICFKRHFLVYLAASGNDMEIPTEATAAVKKKIC